MARVIAGESVGVPSPCAAKLVTSKYGPWGLPGGRAADGSSAAVAVALLMAGTALAAAPTAPILSASRRFSVGMLAPPQGRSGAWSGAGTPQTFANMRGWLRAVNGGRLLKAGAGRVTSFLRVDHRPSGCCP